MNSSELIDEIRRDLVSEAPVSSTLRKCLFLAQATGSDQLRQWATNELEGYSGPISEVPDYRLIQAPLHADGLAGNNYVSGQSLPIENLPVELKDVLRKPLNMVHPIGEIEEMAKGRQSGPAEISLPKRHRRAVVRS